MARKKTLSYEEQLDLQVKRDIEDLTLTSFPESPMLGFAPTVSFEEGDTIPYGQYEGFTVIQKVNNGEAYVLEGEEVVKEKDKEDIKRMTKKVVRWLALIDYSSKGTSFAEKDDIILQSRNVDLSSLINMHFGFGIDFIPDYQRDFVWDDTDREMLLDSIFQNVDIGKFAFRHNGYSGDGCMYEIIDGKQRLATLIHFRENRFKYRGFYYSELSLNDKAHFNTFPVVYLEGKNMTDAQVKRLFVRLNKTGKRVDLDHILKVESEIV